MRVCLNIQAAIGKRTGVGRYAVSIAHELAKLRGEDDELAGFYFDFKRTGSPFDVETVQERVCRWIPGRIVQQSWKRLQIPPYVWFAGKADVHHFPNFVVPPRAWRQKSKMVVSIHDLCFLRFPETVETKNLAYLRAEIGRTVKRASRIYVPCQTIREEMLTDLPVRPDQVKVIPLGVSPLDRIPPKEEVARVRQELGLERPYLMHVGTLEPRKNHVFLIEAFEAMDWFDGDLVLCGMHGWHTEAIVSTIENSPRKDRIRRLDFVPDGALTPLYAGAEAFLFPSLYEGFGLPPFEAMQVGTPAICSAGGSLGEVIEPGGIVLREFDAAAWSESTRKVVCDSEFREALVSGGFEHAKSFPWSETARQLWQSYREVSA